MKRVITYGTFDLLHYGHINLLKRAKELGDYLIVGLSTDKFNSIEKGKKTYFSYEERKQLLESIRYVDLVIPECNWEQKITPAIHIWFPFTSILINTRFYTFVSPGVSTVYIISR
jgi:glycerol-3-phosphate cytidylyltransferase